MRRHRVPALWRLVVTVVVGIAVAAGNDSSTEDAFRCPEDCLCDDPETLFCHAIELTRVPNFWPTNLKRIVLRNSSITTLHKNSFRKFQQLEELRIEDSFQLEVIDKYAFKGLHRLRRLSIQRNPRLRQIFKATFSGIGNEDSLKIQLKHNGISTIHAYAFKNAHNLRELAIEDKCVRLERHAFSSITKLDFLVVRGACAIESEAFANMTRVHNLHISDSAVNVSQRTFDGLSHVNHILLQNNRIGRIDEDAFAGTSTVGHLQIQSNQIGVLEPRAFAGTENLGTVLITQNVIGRSLETPECILNDAQRFAFTDNTVHCDCGMRWVRHHKDRTFLKENFCGREQAFKALLYFEPMGCPTPPSTLPQSSTVPASHSSPLDFFSSQTGFLARPSSSFLVSSTLLLVFLRSLFAQSLL